MGRTNVDIDDEACARVMARYGFTTKREAINFALRRTAPRLSIERARSMRGTGWDGDLAQMRGSAADLQDGGRSA